MVYDSIIRLYVVKSRPLQMTEEVHSTLLRYAFLVFFRFSSRKLAIYLPEWQEIEKKGMHEYKSFYYSKNAGVKRNTVGSLKVVQ